MDNMRVSEALDSSSILDETTIQSSLKAHFQSLIAHFQLFTAFLFCSRCRFSCQKIPAFRLHREK